MILKRRHIAKAISYRMIASSSTFLITWIVTGEIHTGLKVGGIAVVIKMGLYYLHERMWYRSKFGVKNARN